MTINTTLIGLSQTAASNGPDGAVDAPSTLDDAIRYHGAFIAQLRDGAVSNALSAFTSAGSASAYTITTTLNTLALAANQRYQVTWHASNTTTTPTLTRDGLTAKNIKVYDVTGTKINPAVGAFAINAQTDLVYDGTDYVALNAPPVMAASLVGSGYQKLPSGLILQWISSSVATGGSSFSYPLTFPTAVLMVMSSTNPNNTAQFAVTYGGTTSFTNAAVYNLAGVTVVSNVTIFAIGY